MAYVIYCISIRMLLDGCFWKSCICLRGEIDGLRVINVTISSGGGKEKGTTDSTIIYN